MERIPGKQKQRERHDDDSKCDRFSPLGLGLGLEVELGRGGVLGELDEAGVGRAREGVHGHGDRAAAARGRVGRAGARGRAEGEGRLVRAEALGLDVEEVREAADGAGGDDLRRVSTCGGRGDGARTVDATAEGTLKMMDMIAFRLTSMKTVAIVFARNAMRK
jgi:hypothetical protein